MQTLHRHTQTQTQTTVALAYRPTTHIYSNTYL
jgi:hypothetical protein